jgi:hypothetical protein
MARVIHIKLKPGGIDLAKAKSFRSEWPKGPWIQVDDTQYQRTRGPTIAIPGQAPFQLTETGTIFDILKGS